MCDIDDGILFLYHNFMTDKAKSVQIENPICYQAAVQYNSNTKELPQVYSFFWFLGFANAIDRYSDIKLEKTDVNRSEFAILLDLLKHPEGISQRDIADHAGRTKQTIVTSIDKLENKGYVKRYASPNDRRVNYIRITSKGTDYINSIFPYTQKMCNEALSVISEKELKLILPIIKKITKGLWNNIGVTFLADEEASE